MNDCAGIPEISYPARPVASLQDLLKNQAKKSPSESILCYPFGSTSLPEETSYRDLYTHAQAKSLLIRSLERFQPKRPILLHLNDQLDTILWFWAVLLAKGLPVLSSPLSNIDEHRQKHLRNLSSLLESPICITKADSLAMFTGDHTLELHTIEDLVRQCSGTPASKTAPVLDGYGENWKEDQEYTGGKTTAFLMLTSGSTGDAKAVCLTHHQVLAAVEGKAAIRQTTHRPFFNWIGLDHVASLVEIHIQALWLGVGQIHAHPADVLSSPTRFLDLLSLHRVSRSFAPNFFLAKLVAALESRSDQGSWNLSDLTMLASGGEANDVQTCLAASTILERYGAPVNVITPGFGMTETCAGAIFNLESPQYDIRNKSSISSLGKCIDGMNMRVTVTSSGGSTRPAWPMETGSLEVQGDVVFGQYYRNPEASTEAFTSDGWFRTGDQATIDPSGNLHLTGRTKDVFNINGVKISCSEVQTTLDQALGSLMSRVISFPVRGGHTEQITIACIPRQWPMSVEQSVEIDVIARNACILCCGQSPVVFSLREESVPLLPTTTLGKISRDKMRLLFEQGVFAQDVDLHRTALQEFRQQQKETGLQCAANEMEESLLADFAETLGLVAGAIGPETPLFELGCTSMDMIRLKHRLDHRLGAKIPIVTIMKHPTARSLATALASEALHDSGGFDPPVTADYDPVVTLQPNGTRVPLWLVHPGVGEVMVFLGLAQHMSQDDRPVYALRAKGFEGQQKFSSVAEAVDLYVKAVRQRQPQGPYALAGYSYGTMLAFEMAKKLNSEDGTSDAVRFLGSFNLPPHIKTRMRQLNWNMCLLHLAYFLGITTEEYAESCEQQGFRAISRGAAISHVLEVADHSRLEELGLSSLELANWADVAFGLQVSPCSDLRYSSCADYYPEYGSGL